MDKTYHHFYELKIYEISGLLYYCYNELTFFGNQFIAKTIGTKIQIQASIIKSIDTEYGKNISDRAIVDIGRSNFDSSITKARTLVEETLCCITENDNKIASSGNKK